MVDLTTFIMHNNSVMSQENKNQCNASHKLMLQLGYGVQIRRISSHEIVDFHGCHQGTNSRKNFKVIQVNVNNFENCCAGNQKNKHGGRKRNQSSYSPCMPHLLHCHKSRTPTRYRPYRSAAIGMPPDPLAN